MEKLLKAITEFIGLYVDAFALIIMLATAALALFSYFRAKRARIFTPLIITVIGTFISAVLLFCFCHTVSLPEAVHSTIRFFVVDYEFSQIECVILKALSIIAPLLTFTAIFTLLRDIFSYARLKMNIFSDKYIFSELNEKSVALAESIRKKHPLAAVVFLGAEESEENDHGDLYERARIIRAICFKSDISSVHPNFRFGQVFFFVINEDRDENLKIATRIRRIYGERAKTKMYIFSSAVRAELFTRINDREKIEIRLINEARSVIYNDLYDMSVKRMEKGTPDLFTSATVCGKDKVISAVIVGMGEYGSEMLKALTWFCQMDGYKLRINAFDIGKDAEEHLCASCPELLDGKHNGACVPGEAQYEISITSGVDTESRNFIDQIEKITDASYVFVALGSDEANIAVSMRLRALFERSERSPVIQSVIYNSDLIELLKNAELAGKDKYNIDYFGDLNTVYSENVVMNSRLEAQALNVHKCWPGASEDNFYLNHYNYNSSIASALHLHALLACRKRGDGIKEDIAALSVLEHKRWNAYMRTEGYIYGKNRNDLTKEHPDLVPFNKLSEHEKEKDTRISLSVLNISEPKNNGSVKE